MSPYIQKILNNMESWFFHQKSWRSESTRIKHIQSAERKILSTKDPSELSFKKKEESGIFPDRGILREFFTSRPDL